MAIPIHEIQSPKASPRPSPKSGPKTSGWQKLLAKEIGGGKLKDSFKESFYSELALLLEAGMNVKSALDLLTGQQKKERLKKLLTDTVDQLTRGARFSEVLQKQGKFTAYEYYSVRIGEETGNLVEVLKRLSSFYAQKIQQRRALIGALTYPMVILLTAFLAVTFMLTYMVPMFEDVFMRMGGELPALTRMIIGLSEGFGNFLWLLLTLVGAVTLLHFLYRERPAYRKARAAVVLHVPLVGPMIAKTYTLRLIQSLSLLITSKVPLTEALELSVRMVRFYPIEHSLGEVRKKILQGSSLHDGLALFPIYGHRLVSLIKVGEETNQLGMILTKLSAQMEDELQHRAKILGNTLEPLIIVFLGFLVALILVAMYLPMFQMSGSF